MAAWRGKVFVLMLTKVSAISVATGSKGQPGGGKEEGHVRKAKRRRETVRATAECMDDAGIMTIMESLPSSTSNAIREPLCCEIQIEIASIYRLFLETIA